MEYALLRSLRVLGPGLILLSYFDLFKITVLKSQPFFWALDTAKILLIGYIVGGLYGAITPRFIRDRIAFCGIHSSLIEALNKIDSRVKSHKWNEISPIFYKIIDNDNSLTLKSKGIFFNGLMVTTAVDCLFISGAAVLIGLGITCYINDWQYITAAVAAVAVSGLIWRILIRRHKFLGCSQVNVIQHRFKQEFCEYIASLCRVTPGQ